MTDDVLGDQSLEGCLVFLIGALRLLTMLEEVPDILAVG